MVNPADERLIYLQRVNRQLLKVGQGRIAGAKIIQCGPDSHRAQRFQFCHVCFKCLDQYALCDFQFKRRRRQSGFYQHGSDAFDKIVQRQLFYRHVDTD